MKLNLSFALLLLCLLGCLSCQENLDQSKNDDGNAFEIGRGLNVSHWLSQTTIRGAERAAYVTEDDFITIAKLGFDHVRLPIDEVQFWNEAGEKQADAFKSLHDAIGWSLDNNLRIIVDLHIIRAHHFNDPDNRQLWEDPEAQAGFLDLWRQLSAEMKEYSAEVLAYELMNEAVSEDPEDWNNLINLAISELRNLEPNRVIVMGSNRWQSPDTFDKLRVPEGDKNLILSFHYYKPFAITHYKASWTPFQIYEGPLNYPGFSVDTTTYSTLTPEVLEVVQVFNGYYDQQTLEADIMQAVKVAQKYDLPLYCGEYGCYPSTPMAIRQNVYRDMHAIFDKHDIAWAHWNYKNDFPVVTQDLLPITELLDIMVPN